MIRLRTKVAGASGGAPAGQVLSREDCARLCLDPGALVRGGYAEWVGAEPAPAPAAAPVAEPETAEAVPVVETAAAPYVKRRRFNR